MPKAEVSRKADTRKHSVAPHLGWEHHRDVLHRQQQQLVSVHTESEGRSNRAPEQRERNGFHPAASREQTPDDGTARESSLPCPPQINVHRDTKMKKHYGEQCAKSSRGRQLVPLPAAQSFVVADTPTSYAGILGLHYQRVPFVFLPRQSFAPLINTSVSEYGNAIATSDRSLSTNPTFHVQGSLEPQHRCADHLLSDASNLRGQQLLQQNSVANRLLTAAALSSGCHTSHRLQHILDEQARQALNATIATRTRQDMTSMLGESLGSERRQLDLQDTIPIPSHGSRPANLPGPSNSVVLLACPEDRGMLNEHLVFLRQQIEFFPATVDDIMSHTRGRNRGIAPHQVGVRCRHCSHVPVGQRKKGSTYFPSTLMGIYQAAQNINVEHLQSGLCPEMPREIEQVLSTTRATKTANSGAGKAYWAEAARTQGLVDTDDGIRFAADANKSTLIDSSGIFG